MEKSMIVHFLKLALGGRISLFLLVIEFQFPGDS